MMKNIWFMLLTVCTMFAFSACSDDDEKNPTNPVSNAKVPATVQIGEEMIITGTGFTAPGIALYLEDAEKNRTKLDATFSAAGATCTVPELTPGTFGVILTQEGHEWELGKTALEAGPNPIVSPALPEGIVYIGKQVTIGGSGYEASDKISLNQEEGDAIEISEVAVTESGLQFTLPKDLPAGTYTVSLIRGVQSWTLEGTLNVQKEKRIKSISVENGFEITITYNTNNQLISMECSDMGLAWNINYTENQITTECSIGSIDELTFDLQDGKIIKSTEPNPYDETETYNIWTYNQNLLTSVINEGELYQGENFEIIYSGGNISEFGSNKFKYSEEAQHAISGTIDVVYALHLPIIIYKEDFFLGLFLNKNTNASTLIPTHISIEEQNEDGSSGYNDYPIHATWENNTLTLKCDSQMIGTVVIAYEDIE